MRAAYTESLKVPSELFIPVTPYGSAEPKLIWATRNQALRERLRPLARLRANGAVSRDHVPQTAELRPSWRVTGYFPVADRFSDEQRRAIEELALASPLPVLIDGEPPDTWTGIAKIVSGLLISAVGLVLLALKGRTTLRGVPQSSNAPSGNVA